MVQSGAEPAEIIDVLAIARPVDANPNVARVRQVLAAHGFLDVPPDMLGVLARDVRSKRCSDRAVIRRFRSLVDARLRDATRARPS